MSDYCYAIGEQCHHAKKCPNESGDLRHDCIPFKPRKRKKK